VAEATGYNKAVVFRAIHNHRANLILWHAIQNDFYSILAKRVEKCLLDLERQRRYPSTQSVVRMVGFHFDVSNKWVPIRKFVESAQSKYKRVETRLAMMQVRGIINAAPTRRKLTFGFVNERFVRARRTHHWLLTANHSILRQEVNYLIAQHNSTSST
jgi:hypothetical protein